MLGPNGAGKSTVLVGRRGPAAARPRPRARSTAGCSTGAGTWVPPHERRVALLAQEPLLFPHLSVLDNVAFGPRSSGRRAAYRPGRGAALAGRGRRRRARRPQAGPALRRPGPAGRAWPARSRPSPGCCCSTSRWRPSTSRSRPRCGRRSSGCSPTGPRSLVTHDVARRAAARGPGRGDGGRPGRRGRADRARCWSGRAARSPPGSPGSTWSPAPGATAPSTGIRRHGGRPGAGRRATRWSRCSGPARSRCSASAPGGSPRNTLPVTVTEIEPRGDQVRVRAGHLAADVTAAGGRRARPRARAPRSCSRSRRARSRSTAREAWQQVGRVRT